MKRRARSRASQVHRRVAPAEEVTSSYRKLRVIKPRATFFLLPHRKGDMSPVRILRLICLRGNVGGRGRISRARKEGEK